MTSQRADFHWFRTSWTAVEGSAGRTTQTFLIFPWSSLSSRWRFCVAVEKTLGEVNASPELSEIINTTEALPRHLHVDGDWFRMWLLQKSRRADAARRSRSIIETEPWFPSQLECLTFHQPPRPPPPWRSLAGWCRRGPGTSPRTGPDYSERDKEPPADKRPGRFFFYFFLAASGWTESAWHINDVACLGAAGR